LSWSQGPHYGTLVGAVTPVPDLSGDGNGTPVPGLLKSGSDRQSQVGLLAKPNPKHAGASGTRACLLRTRPAGQGPGLQGPGLQGHAHSDVAVGDCRAAAAAPARRTRRRAGHGTLRPQRHRKSTGTARRWQCAESNRSQATAAALMTPHPGLRLRLPRAGQVAKCPQAATHLTVPPGPGRPGGAPNQRAGY
jgi:hypothetical protein